MTDEYQRVAEILADARAEALEERPLATAAVNSITKRLAHMYGEHDPSFDQDEFYAVANYQGRSDGTEQLGILPTAAS